MPDEENGSDTSDEENPDPIIEPPQNSARNHNEPTHSSDKHAQRKAESTAELEQDIRRGERWLIGIGIATLVTNTLIAWIYWGQLKAMRKATIAAVDSAQAAKSASVSASAGLRALGYLPGSRSPLLWLSDRVED